MEEREFEKQIKNLKNELQGEIKAREYSELSAQHMTQSLYRLNQELQGKVQELTRVKDYFSCIIRTIMNALIVSDEKGEIRLVNEAVCHLLKYTEEELLGKPVKTVIPEEVLGSFLEEADYYQQIEAYYLNQDNEKIPVLITRSPLVEEDWQEAILYVAQDIREKKKNEKLALDNIRLQQTSEIAHQIQTALLLDKVDIKGFDIAINTIPAEKVGGDFYDFLLEQENQFWLAIGDVSGHGMHAGMIMMMAQSSLSTLVNSFPENTPAKILQQINQLLFQNVRNRMGKMEFMTFLLCRHIGEGHFVCAGAHEQIIIYRAQTGKCECLMSEGVWLGLMPDIQNATKELTFSLQTNDILVLYTDGVIESKNFEGKQYDVPRLIEAIIRYHNLKAKEIEEKIIEDVCNWQTYQEDDITLLIVKKIE